MLQYWRTVWIFSSRFKYRLSVADLFICHHLQSAYKLMFPERGLAVIFSNEFFTDARLERRLGNKLDVDNLACLFKMLQFEVEPFSDLTDTVSLFMSPFKILPL